MAYDADTAETYDVSSTSMREDLTSIIEDISPLDCPFYQMIGRGTAKNTWHEWQASKLAAAVDTNALPEGEDASIDAAIATYRYGNYTQISGKTLAISGTIMEVDLAGIANYKGWQLMKKAQELKRDVDKQLCTDTTADAGQADTAEARTSAGYESFFGVVSPGFVGDATENVERGTNGVGGGWENNIFNDPTDGIQRALTEDLLTSVLAMCWDDGGNPTKVLCGSFNKRKISGFTGNSTRFDKGEDKSLTAAIDVYIGDFNTVDIIPSRHVRPRSVLVVDPDLWAICFLRKYETFELARTGDAQSWQMVVEYTLRGNNPHGSGLVADCTTS